MATLLFLAEIRGNVQAAGCGHLRLDRALKLAKTPDQYASRHGMVVESGGAVKGHGLA